MQATLRYVDFPYHIYTSMCVCVYIYLLSFNIAWASSPTTFSVSTSELRYGRLYLQVVRDASGIVPSPDSLPLSGACEPSCLLVYFVATQPLPSISLVVIYCAAHCLFRDEYKRPTVLHDLFHSFSHALRALYAPQLAECPAVSLILSSLRPENLTWLTRLRHRPPYELRAYVNQYICKFFLCFFSRVQPAYFFYYYVFFIFILAYFSVDYRTYTTRSIV